MKEKNLQGIVGVTITKVETLRRLMSLRNRWIIRLYPLQISYKRLCVNRPGTLTPPYLFCLHRIDRGDEMDLRMPKAFGKLTGGCEWNPDEGSPSWSSDEHYRYVQATVIVGANGRWRLCDSCSRLPRFRRFRIRKPIKKAAQSA